MKLQKSEHITGFASKIHYLNVLFVTHELIHYLIQETKCYEMSWNIICCTCGLATASGIIMEYYIQCLN